MLYNCTNSALRADYGTSINRVTVVQFGGDEQEQLDGMHQQNYLFVHTFRPLNMIIVQGQSW